MHNIASVGKTLAGAYAANARDALWTCEEDKNGKDIFHAAKPNRFAFADFTFVEIFFFGIAGASHC